MDEVLYQQKQARMETILQFVQRELGDISLVDFLEYARSQQVYEQEAKYFSTLAHQSENAVTAIQADPIRE